MKKILIIVGIVVGVFVGVVGGLFALKNPLIKSAVTTGATQVTGAPVYMDDFSLSILNQSVRIRGFTVYNPEGFPKGVLLDAPEISVDCDVNSLLGGKLHLPYIAVNLKEMAVIRNKEGRLNVDVIREALGQGEPSEEEEEAEVPTEEEPSEPMEMQIDVMKLSVGKVVYKDYSIGDKPKVITLDVGIKEKTYKNITSAQQFGVIVLREVMGHKFVKEAILEGVASAIGVEGIPKSIEDVTGIAGKMILGKEGGSVDFNVDYNQAFKAALNTIQEMGKVTKDDKADGVIKGKVGGSTVTIEIGKKAEQQVQIKVEAKKLVIPQPKLTKKILAKITGELKK